MQRSQSSLLANLKAATNSRQQGNPWAVFTPPGVSSSIVIRHNRRLESN